MTHCLNCGAQSSSDECLHCGLTAAAAELEFRRRFTRRTGFFLLGAVVFVPTSQLFPPLELDRIWIFGGVIFFAALALAVLLNSRARRHQEIEVFKRIYFGLVPVLWVLAALLYANGKFDYAQPERHTATVVSHFRMPGLPRGDRLVVTSWRDGRLWERVPVDRDEYDRFPPGDNVVILVQGGLAGVPWVSGVDHP
jgi:hypothetical protein